LQRNAPADIATIVQSFAVTAGLGGTWWQLRSAHRENVSQIQAQHWENKQWETLDICAQYEFNDTVSNAARNIGKALRDCDNPNHSKSPTFSAGACKEIARDATVLLNYLDGIAIGPLNGAHASRQRLSTAGQRQDRA
jgi:hypothetical protein